MENALLVAGGIIGFALLMLPTGLIWRGFKNLKDTWQGKSKNSRSDNGV